MKLEFQKVERTYVSNVEHALNNTNILEFIKNNFKIPDDNLKEISSFIKKDSELEKIIFELPNMIKKEFPNDKLQIRFYDEFTEDELILEVGIFTSFGEKTSFEKEKKLENMLYENYGWDSADKVLIIMEYENE